MKTMSKTGTAVLLLSLVLAQSAQAGKPDEIGRMAIELFSNPAFVTMVSKKHYILSPRIRDLAAKKPVAFTSEGLALPPGFNGEIKGFTMVNVRAGGLFDRMGLKRGDVLYEVNGMPLRDFADSRNAYRKLKNEPRISLSILREDKSITLVYEFREAG